MRNFTIQIMITILLFNSVSLAQYRGSQIGDDVYQSRINEYFFNKTDRDVLHPVKIFGSVQKPGLYHLPTNTNLSTLFSISGGTTSDADTEKIVIRRADGTVLKKDLYNIVSKSDEVALAEGDVIYIPKQESFMSSPTANNVLVIASVLSVILSGIIVSRGTH